MAASEFEEVATVAVQKCDALEALAGGIWEDMTELDQDAGTLADALATAVAEMGNRMRSLVSDVQAAKTRTEGATGGVETALQELLGSVGEVVRDYKQEGDRIMAAAQRIGALAEEPVTALNEMVPLVDKGMAAVDTGVERLGEVLGSGSVEAIDGLKSAVAALDSAREKVDEAQTEWAQQLDVLTLGAGIRIGMLLRDLALVADAHARGVVEMLNEGIAPHNALAQELTTDLTDETGMFLSPAKMILHDRGTTLQSALETRTEGLTERGTAVAEAAPTLTGDLGTLATALAELSGVGSPA